MTTQYRESLKEDIAAFSEFIYDLTSEEPTLLSDLETLQGYVSFEIPRWSTSSRQRYKMFETERSYSWVYMLHAYGKRFHLYISKLPVTIFELMENEELIHEFEMNETVDIDESIFGKSMIVI